MSGYLLDTNVLSEIRKGPRANSNVLRWLDPIGDDALFLSVLIAGEVRKGIEQVRSRDLVQARLLEQWLEGFQRVFGDRILPVTTQIADHWGRLAAMRPMPPIDGLLAATALIHDLTLATRNVAHVEHTGVKIVDPFQP